jgi:hypothetical protein
VELFIVLAMIIVMPAIKLLISVITSRVELIVPYPDARILVKLPLKNTVNVGSVLVVVVGNNGFQQRMIR